MSDDPQRHGSESASRSDSVRSSGAPESFISASRVLVRMDRPQADRTDLTPPHDNPPLVRTISGPKVERVLTVGRGERSANALTPVALTTAAAPDHPPAAPPRVAQAQIAQAPANSIAATPASGGLVDSGGTSAKRSPTRPDPITQSLMLLATMSVMLLAARFAVPPIVEEIRYGWHRGELRAEYESGTEGLKNVSLDALSEAYQMVTAAVGPSVVHIEVERRTPLDQADAARLLSVHLLPSSDQGSGVVIDKAGYLLTNRHVIADGEDITVTLSDGRRVPAVVLGTDEMTDLALLKVDAKGLIPITWGDSDRLKVGSPVWAVGSPFGLDRTVTFGILSGKHRMVRASTQYQDFMQSDVAVNPGNSGGPLVDARGTLVGINTAIVGDTYQGVSFSIPSNVAKQIYQRLRDVGRVERGWLGVALDEVPDDRLIGDNARIRGALIIGVADQQSPAGRAGLRAGDLIVAVADEAIRDVGHLMRKIGEASAGDSIRLDVRRDGEPTQIDVLLGARPETVAVK